MSWAIVGGLAGLASTALQGGQKSNQSQYYSNNSSNNSTSTSNASVRPNVPVDWQNLFNLGTGALGAGGATNDQSAVASFLKDNYTNGGFLTPSYGTARDVNGQAIDAARAGGSTSTGGANYLAANQDLGSNTLGKWFGDATGTGLATTAPASVTGGTGAAYMGAYSTPLTNDYINASLADYDQGAAQGYNALRASNASAFGNKRTGVAEGQFQADAARGRAELSSGLRLNAFNTAAGLGQTDASRALTADTTNAGNALSTNQFNSTLANNRQQFDINQADEGDDRRLGIANNLVSAGGAQTANAGALSSLGSSGLNNAINLNNTRVANALASGNFGNMTFGQIIQLLGAGTPTIGTDTTSDSTSTGTSSSSGTGSGQSSQPADVIGGALNGGLLAYLLNKNRA